MTTHTTREAWLLEASNLLAPILKDADLGLGDVRVSCGWPARGALARSKRRVGECWPAGLNKDGQSHVFVSPCKDDALEVLGILLHELIHAALPAKVGHKGPFTRAAKACGLEGKPTQTVVGEPLAARLNAEIIPALGLYPHVAIDTSTKPKQGTRLRLYECQCPVKVRVASDEFDATCNVCSEPFVKQGGAE